MGLFASRPEEPTEWAGLPSEPLPPRSAAEALADGSSMADLGFVAVPVESIVIPLTPEIQIAEADGAAVSDDEATEG